MTDRLSTLYKDLLSGSSRRPNRKPIDAHYHTLWLAMQGVFHAFRHRRLTIDKFFCRASPRSALYWTQTLYVQLEWQ